MRIYQSTNETQLHNLLFSRFLIPQLHHRYPNTATPTIPSQTTPVKQPSHINQTPTFQPPPTNIPRYRATTFTTHTPAPVPPPMSALSVLTTYPSNDSVLPPHNAFHSITHPQHKHPTLHDRTHPFLRTSSHFLTSTKIPHPHSPSIPPHTPPRRASHMSHDPNHQ